MAYESFPSAPIQKKETFSLTEKKMLQHKLDEMHEGALLEEDFVIQLNSDGETYGLYTEDEIKKDTLKVEDIQKSFDLKEKRNEVQFGINETQQNILETSQYLEALFYEKLGGKNGWIPNATVWKTSKYDDFVNGIDFVVEIEDQNFGIAIDVTLSRRSEIIQGKLKKTKKLIDQERLAEIKYYERPEDGEKGSVPLIVMALDYNHAVQALKLWSEGENELLSKHPTRVKAWLEAQAQFEAFSLYAKNQEKYSVSKVYSDAQTVIENIIKEHKEVVDQYKQTIEKDEAYQTIIEFCEDLKRTTY